MKRVSVLGATGSIGQNTLDLIRRDRDAFEVVALTAGRNVDQLARDAREFQADLAVIGDETQLDALRDALAGTGTKVAAGEQAIIEAGAHPADWVMSAIVGFAGLAPGLAALEQGATLALANKESLVAAGALLLDTAQQHNAKVLPVDSEHSAIFQALIGEEPKAVSRVIITASGGAFRDWPIEKLTTATAAEAATHPNWDMGQRITIDSASMFNKALEMIEAREFFDFTPDQIEVLVHPQSLVHALVGFCDGGLMAHVGPHDMRHAIGFALNWPERRPLPVDMLDLAKAGTLDFETPDLDRFPPLRLARHVMEKRGHSGAVFNGAKERALDHFIAGRIGFLQMSEVVEEVLTRILHQCGLNDDVITLDTARKADHLARDGADAVVHELIG
ncbi:1-deoxy-D-xylulose-5-phosphate reductoisomerase [Roseovarius rhodophyticola]|uniref:1-deoxy-D-xylulose 5-phosphate reductoisomerase n=1 Tax=Roseovarius rhodophyticola TaxID=3080827 RepID=A0ABZ2THR4_9RHOB|nr:1-deoxy-D-xylulose-5-phosphate reductoisomerase [Roseovarius sp. W115]MDV2928204.1 1-deoxy-D-xylulose-5-phosphate reductoisomerase [Roseovarius sp. W115]